MNFTIPLTKSESLGPPSECSAVGVPLCPYYVPLANTNSAGLGVTFVIFTTALRPSQWLEALTAKAKK